MTDPALRPARRRIVWPWVLLGVVVLLAVLVVAAEFAARALVRDEVAARLATALEVEPSDVVVELDDGILLTQLLGGTVDGAEVTVTDLALGPLVGELRIDAAGIPLDAAAPTRELRVSYAVPEDVLERVAADSTGIAIDALTLKEPEIVATGRIELFGNAIDLGLGITPGADAGSLTFTPTSVLIGGNTIDVGDLSSNPVFGPLAELVAPGFEVCVAQELPAALTLTDVVVDGTDLVAHFDGSGQALGGDAYRTRGACA